jgi:hypothetical protein
MRLIFGIVAIATVLARMCGHAESAAKRVKADSRYAMVIQRPTLTEVTGVKLV